MPNQPPTPPTAAATTQPVSTRATTAPARAATALVTVPGGTRGPVRRVRSGGVVHAEANRTRPMPKPAPPSATRSGVTSDHPVGGQARRPPVPGPVPAATGQAGPLLHRQGMLRHEL